MRNKKLLIIVIAAAAAIVLAIVGVWTLIMNGTLIKKETTATVDGQISYSADEETKAAMQKLSDGCDSADIVGSDPSQKEKTIALGFYGLSDSVANDEILRLLEDNGYEATFFLTALEAADNEDFLQNLLDKGNDLASYGLNGISQAEDETQTDLVDEMAHSQKVLTTLSDNAAELLYCSDTLYTAAVRQAAYASGFSKVVFVEDENTLDYTSLTTQADVNNYLTGLEAGTLVMIRIDGQDEEIPDEPTVEPDTPAVDKQPDADVSDTETEEIEENAVQLTTWLLEAMEKRNYKAIPVDSLAALEDSDYQSASGNEDKEALVYTSFLTDHSEVALALWNLPDADSMEKVTKLLEKYNADATFFVTEEELANRSEELSALMESGYSLGNGGDSIADCAKALESVTNEKLMVWLPVSQLPLEDAYDEAELRQTASSEGYALAAPENPETPEAGAFYGFDLSESDALEQLEAMLTGCQSSSLAVSDVSQLVADFGQLPTLTSSEVQALRTENNGELAEAVDYVYTTERALSFLFYGVSNKPVINDIREKLEDHDATATFFVTFDEMQSETDTIEKLLADGHEVGIAYVESETYPATFDSMVRYLNSCAQYFEWRYRTELKTVFLPYADANEEVEEAISSMGLSLAGHNISMVQSKHKDLKIDGISELLETDFSKVNITRGSQVYFNTSFYTADQALSESSTEETVCGAMVEAVFTSFIDPIAYQDEEGNVAEDSRYQVKTCVALRSSEECYTLTADLADCEISEDNSVVTSMDTEEEQANYIAERYIGTPSADTSEELPGFTWNERSKLDKTGRFTDEPVLFLSFDDWGTDESINHLLYVLEKYNIKATFYVRANYVSYNPNLLRAIAVEGHEIASHSYSHLPLADTEGSHYISLTDEEAAELREDLVKSYQELYTYVGDVTVNGVAALSKNFRPPTLAASKIGMTEVLDVGFEYIVSGDFSTHDYEAESVEELVNQFKYGISTWRGRQKLKNGSVIVMHMSEEAQYTAQTLDQMIPTWKEQGYSFERVDTGLAEAAAASEEAEETP